MSTNDEREEKRGKRTDESAVVQGTGEIEDPDKFARAAGRGEGADEGMPPGGDVRTVYENEREPGEATPTKQ